ncbi:hypothetical protein RFI_01219 [Reticulomyxa filosa]|uniref:Uncharacterized protein n=1 Tax=Reticulomyxa filosa TaxID=46433 RepID=X6PCL2_RETFI|nr:hypothetical protein RFI_01219 [Reticulomyxa filosa]|eukprot:ETO35843.1 hypothetical protein RFI_01219 [Reticulomyxa filosa]
MNLLKEYTKLKKISSLKKCYFETRSERSLEKERAIKNLKIRMGVLVENIWPNEAILTGVVISLLCCILILALLLIFLNFSFSKETIDRSKPDKVSLTYSTTVLCVQIMICLVICFGWTNLVFPRSYFTTNFCRVTMQLGLVLYLTQKLFSYLLFIGRLRIILQGTYAGCEKKPNKIRFEFSTKS